jgi:hypothetical protein
MGEGDEDLSVETQVAKELASMRGTRGRRFSNVACFNPQASFIFAPQPTAKPIHLAVCYTLF